MYQLSLNVIQENEEEKKLRLQRLQELEKKK